MLANSYSALVQYNLFQTLSGRPKRAASMSVQERGRARKKRRVRIIDSDGSGVCGVM